MLDHITVYPSGAIHGHYPFNGQMITCEYDTRRQPPNERSIPDGIRTVLKSVMEV